MTTFAWLLVGVLVYLVIGIVLKNHTRIGTVQFKDHSTRFIIFYIFPIGGLVFYVASSIVYCFIMTASEVIFEDATIGPNKFFVIPNWPEYPDQTDN